MSLFHKVFSRAALQGLGPTVQARPKRGATLARQEEEEEAQPMRRQAQDEEMPLETLRREDLDEDAGERMTRRAPQSREPEDDAAPVDARLEEEEEEEARPLRRQPEDDEEEPLQALHRLEEEEETAQPLRRTASEATEDDEPARARRTAAARYGDDEDDEVQPLRRAGSGETDAQEDEAMARPLRRITPPDASQLEADNAPLPEESAGEPEIPDLRALRRDASQARQGPRAGALPAWDVTAGDVTLDGGYANAGADDAGAIALPSPPDLPAHAPFAKPLSAPPAANAATTAATERPRVTIDQVDVVIHENAVPGASAPSASAEIARLLRTRYLGGL